MANGKTREDTRIILRVGTCVFIAGLFFASMVYFSGGMTQHGPHTNAGWFGLIFALCCLPSSGFLLLLGGAKWLGDRKK